MKSMSFTETETNVMHRCWGYQENLRNRCWLRRLAAPIFLYYIFVSTFNTLCSQKNDWIQIWSVSKIEKHTGFAEMKLGSGVTNDNGSGATILISLIQIHLQLPSLHGVPHKNILVSRGPWAWITQPRKTPSQSHHSHFQLENEIETASPSATMLVEMPHAHMGK